MGVFEHVPFCFHYLLLIMSVVSLSHILTHVFVSFLENIEEKSEYTIHPLFSVSWENDAVPNSVCLLTTTMTPSSITALGQVSVVLRVGNMTI